MTATEKILTVARSFPCLEDKIKAWPDGKKFDPDLFRGLMHGWSHGEQLCGLIVLNIWNPAHAKASGWTFDLFDFIAVADRVNRDALIAWMQNPVWP